MIRYILDVIIIIIAIVKYLYNYVEKFSVILGDVLGAAATIFAVVITIKNNEKSIRRQRLYEIKPYIDSKICFLEEVGLGNEKLIFDFVKNDVGFIKYRADGFDKSIARNEKIGCVSVGITITNVGAGNAIDMNISVDGLCEKSVLLKNEVASFAILKKVTEFASIEVLFDYWNIEHSERYRQRFVYTIINDDGDWSVSETVRDAQTVIEMR